MATGRGKENLGGGALNYPTVITLISCIPSSAPVLQPPWLQRKYFCPLSQKAKVQVWGLHVDFLSPSGVKWSHIEAEYGGLLWLLAEQECTVLGRLAELDHTLAAAHAEKSLRLAGGVAQLHRLIGQLEDRCLPQVSALLTESSPKVLLMRSLIPFFLPFFLLGCWSILRRYVTTGCFTSLSLQLRRGTWLIHPPHNTRPCHFFSQLE